MEAAEKIEPYTPNEVWARFTYTAEENKVLESTGQDVNKYVEEMPYEYITSDMDVEQGRDAYVETIEKVASLVEFVDFYQETYERKEEQSIEYYNVLSLE